MEQKQKYSNMTTEALQELLRQDCDDTAPLPLEDILKICGILAQRTPPHRSAEEAWEEFFTHCMPEAECRSRHPFL